MQEPPGQSLENFYPRPPRGGRLPPCRQCHWRVDFYPRPPRGGRHGEWWDSWDSGAISIHALREEGDLAGSFSSLWARYFYPRPPRGGRLSQCRQSRVVVCISIHALREEGDKCSHKSLFGTKKFLSTPSARRATTYAYDPGVAGEFLSTPSARRATFSPQVCQPLTFISIHALREEGDLGCPSYRCVCASISIHALREEGDSKNRDKISIFKQIIQHSARI